MRDGRGRAGRGGPEDPSEASDRWARRPEPGHEGWQVWSVSASLRRERNPPTTPARSAADRPATDEVIKVRGLSQAEAAARLRRDGPNVLPVAGGVSAWRQLGRQILHFFAAMLWVEDGRTPRWKEGSPWRIARSVGIARIPWPVWTASPRPRSPGWWRRAGWPRPTPRT
ncbi:MAG TPA: cation-transporting P-type ATPase [Actinomycetota bacterium]